MVENIKLYSNNGGRNIIIGIMDNTSFKGIAIKRSTSKAGEFSSEWNTSAFTRLRGSVTLDIDIDICRLYTNNILVFNRSKKYCIDLNKGVIRHMMKGDFDNFELSKRKNITLKNK
jgi:hypothetical protein